MAYPTKQGRLASNHKRRTRLVTYFKSKCTMCEQKLHAAALTFRYRDGEEPALNIERCLLQGMGLSKLFNEAKKCDLVCRNCLSVAKWAKENEFIRS